MFTIRNLGGVALFLFGTTFLWLTPDFASRGISTTGTWWSLSRVLSLMTLLGFTVATWALFERASWWETTAVASAVLGAVVLIPYAVAAYQSGETSPGFNVLIHAVGSACILLLLLVPPLERWVNSHVMSG